MKDGQRILRYCSVILIFEKSIFRTVVNAIGSERILYGSDYPLDCTQVNPRRLILGPFWRHSFD